MPNAKHALVLPLTGLLLGGCASVGGQLSDIVFVPNPNSDRRTEESVDIEIAYSVNAPMDDRGGEKAIDAFEETLTSGRALSAAEVAVDLVARTLVAEAERYTASYSAEAASDSFYHAEAATKAAAEISSGKVKSKSDIKFAGFKLTRKVREDRSSKIRTAMSICAIALPSRDDKFVQIVPVSYEFAYSKAKLVAFDFLSPFGVDLFNPWEAVTNPLNGIPYQLPPGDTTLDLNVAVTMNYMWLDNSEVSGKSVGPFSFSMKNVRVSGAPRGGYFSAYKQFADDKGDEFSLFCDENATGEKLAALRDRVMSMPMDDMGRLKLGTGATLFPAAPRSIDGEEGNGNFILKIEVTEFDDYGKRVKEIGSTFEENKSTIQKRIDNFIGG